MSSIDNFRKNIKRIIDELYDGKQKRLADSIRVDPSSLRRMLIPPGSITLDTLDEYAKKTRTSALLLISDDYKNKEIDFESGKQELDLDAAKKAFDHLFIVPDLYFNKNKTRELSEVFNQVYQLALEGKL